MKKAKVLFISQEITPFLDVTEVSNIARFSSSGRSGKRERNQDFHATLRFDQWAQESTARSDPLIRHEPDYRRFRSPLWLSKLPRSKVRMQVYFIDNEEYFQRKMVFVMQRKNSTKTMKTAWYFSVAVYLRQSRSLAGLRMWFIVMVGWLPWFLSL